MVIVKTIDVPYDDQPPSTLGPATVETMTTPPLHVT
jgi:hypothetical protein